MNVSSFTFHILVLSNWSYISFRAVPPWEKGRKNEENYWSRNETIQNRKNYLWYRRYWIVSFSILSIESHFDGEYRWKSIFTKALQPFVLFAQESIIQILGIYMAFVYGLYYSLSSYPSLFGLCLLWVSLSLPDCHAKHICRHLQGICGHRRLTLLRAWCWAHNSVSNQCTTPGSYLHTL